MTASGCQCKRLHSSPANPSDVSRRTIRIWKIIIIMVLIHYHVTSCGAINLVDDPRLWQVLRPDSARRHVERYGQNIHSGFGHALTQFPDSAVMFMVSAPRNDDPDDTFENRGSVFVCDLDESTCKKAAFMEPNSLKTFSVAAINFSNSNFGFSIDVTDTWILACSPRLIHVFDLTLNNMSKLRPNELDMPGLCQLMYRESNSTVSRTFLIQQPGMFSWKNQNFNHEGFGLFGFASAIAKRSGRVIISAPGSYYFRGQIYSIELPKLTQSTDYKVRESNSNRFPTNASDDFSDDWCYRGYDLKLGNFDDDTLEDIVTSVPRLNKYIGAVEMYSSNLTIMGTLGGVQPTAYFGYSICVVDINGDGLDDIIVGSPMYTDKANKKQECGMVHVFLQQQTQKSKFKLNGMIMGKLNRGRFGIQISPAGDINGDGYQDVAISVNVASNNGSVHIYLGSPTGLSSQASQVLVSPIDIRGFGGFVSAWTDRKSNNRGLLVGASQSDAVFIIRSRPTVNVEKGAFFSPNFIEIRSNPNDANAPRNKLNITICLRYRDNSVPAKLKFTAVSALDTASGLMPRLIFPNNKSSVQFQFNLNRHELHCFTHTVKQTEDFKDKMTPVKFSFNFSLVNKDLAGNESMLSLMPILNASKTNKIEFEIPMENNCGDDRICVPDLVLNVHSVQSDFKFESKQPITFVVSVESIFEDAFEARCLIDMPSYVDLVFVNTSMDPSLYCAYTEPTAKHRVTISCELGNPLVAGETKRFSLQAQPSMTDRLEKTMKFKFNVTSKNLENRRTLLNNVKEIEVEMESQPRISIVGHTEHDQLHWNTSGYFVMDPVNLSQRTPFSPRKLSDIGPPVEHLYKLRNIGVIPISQLTLDVQWPSHIADTESHLLYLTVPPELRRPEAKENRDFCVVSSGAGEAAVNPLGLSKDDSNTSGGYGQSSKRIKRLTKTAGSGTAVQAKNNTSVSIACTVFDLQPGHHALLIIKSRAWLNSLAKESISTLAATSLCYVRDVSVKYGFMRPVHTDLAKTETMIYIGEQKLQAKFPDAWIVIVSALAGLAVLLGLVLLLWYTGFFRRIRVRSCRQEFRLSRNGIVKNDYANYLYDQAGTLHSYKRRFSSSQCLSNKDSQLGKQANGNHFAMTTASNHSDTVVGSSAVDKHHYMGSTYL